MIDLVLITITAFPHNGGLRYCSSVNGCQG
jgi:hypothetical protein